jgi:ligand-binding sensor domain-containing protein
MNLMGVRFLVFFLFLTGTGFSQDLKLEYITSDDGLSHSSVNCIIKDNEGFMWFGTANGLNRYDGYSFVKYYHDAKNANTIAGDQIQDLLIDHEGELWVATNNGLSQYDRNQGTFINYSHNDSIPNSYLRRLKKQTLGRIDWWRHKPIQ